MVRLYNVYRRLSDGVPYLESKKVLKQEEVRLLNVDSVVKFMRECFKPERLTEEYFWEICCDAALNVLGVFEVSKGGIDSAMVSTSTIFRNAVLLNARYIMLGHNHPSGDCKPSAVDISLTDRLKEAGETIGISVIEHVILGKGKCHSILTGKNIWC